MKFIDNFLNSITMYRLVLYGLGILAFIAIALSFFGIIPFTPLSLIISGGILLSACFATNFILVKLTGQPINLESADITALILFFILMPPTTVANGITIALTGIIAMVSKYIFAVKRRHMFNPAAIALVIIGLFGSGLAIWWMATPRLLPFTLILGLLIVKKLRRFPMFFTYVIVALLTLLVYGIKNGMTIPETLVLSFVSYPLIFLGTIMLTEPLTTPPTKNLQMTYGGIVGLLFGLQFQLGPMYSTPELALVLGNIFSYIVSPKEKLKLILESSQQLSSDVHEFIFKSATKLNFKAGQFMEWTLPRLFLDSRGNRRYFTIASSPTEESLRIGMRFFPDGSRFKKELLAMKEGEAMWASQLAGEFILPEDSKQKLVFIAGGIGITPFRSMIKQLIDTNEQRDIVLFYACLKAEQFVYEDIFKQGEAIGLKTVYLCTETDGYLSTEMLAKQTPDYAERTFYLSGPNAMVESYKKLLLGLGISDKQIVKDYFPGF